MKLNEFNIKQSAGSAAKRVAGAAGNMAKNAAAHVGAEFGHTGSKIRLGGNKEKKELKKIAKQAKVVAARAFDQWADHLGRLVVGGTDVRKDPANYKTKLEAWAKQFFKIGNNSDLAKIQFSPTGNLHRAAKEYIGKITQKYMESRRSVRESVRSPVETLIFETNAVVGIFPRAQLFEAAKNLHMEHLEDLILNQGAAGVEAAKQYVLNTAEMLRSDGSKTSNISVKFDGAPAVFCGLDPADNKFFVGTKGVFAKDPKLVKNSADLKKWYGDKPELAAKLEAALKHLPKLGIKGVLQGDMMFTPGDLKTETIDNENYIVFTPNTITYAVAADSDTAAEIKRAKIGIVFHTSYSGERLEDMTASFGFSANEFAPSADVWVRDALYKDLSGVATLSTREEQQIVHSMASVEQVVGKLGNSRLDVVLKHSDFVPALKIFMNQRVRAGSSVGDPYMFLKDFLAFFKERMQNEIGKLKGGPESPAGKKRVARAQEIEDFVGDNMNTLLGVMAIYKHLIQAKLVLLRKLQTINTIGTFIRTDKGYEVTSPEGFVAIGHDGEAVKLVDRLEFSMQNFNSVKDWGGKK